MRVPRAIIIPRWGECFERVEVLLVLVFALSLYGEALPYGVPLVLPVTVIGFLWFAVVKRSISLKLNAGFVLVILCFALYLMAVLRTAHLYDINRRELRNAVTVILFGPLLFNMRYLQQFQRFRDQAQLVGVVLGTALAILGLYKFHQMANGRTIPLIWFGGRPYPWGTSLIVDYNFYAFAMLCGAISCCFCLFRFSSVAIRAICVIAFCLNLISLSLSGSRRGWVTEVLFVAVLLFLLVKWLTVRLFVVRNSVPSPARTLKIVACIVLLGTLGPLLSYRYEPTFMTSKDGKLQQELEDLGGRLDTLRDPAESFGSRTSRWEYASHVLNEAPAFQLLFGQGFDYLRVFGNVFNAMAKDAVGNVIEDYPHNPLISAALYSGIVGSFVVVVFIFMALFRFIRQRNNNMYFLALYFASLWFVLPAYNSIFSGKLFGFLLLIPWSIPEVSDSSVCAGSSAHSSRFTRSGLQLLPEISSHASS
jgi:hypothetical protein